MSTTASFRLLCKMIASATTSDERLNEAIQQHQDWAGFLQQLRWHRVYSLVWPVIQAHASELPDEVVQATRDLNKQNVMQAMFQTAELSRLAVQFKAMDIRYLVLKGRPLSQWLYQDYTLRFSKDLDLLIRPEDLAGAHELLVELGYVRVIPDADIKPHVLDRYTEFRKDFTYLKAGLQIELHWKLDNNPHLLSVEKILPFTDIQWVDIPGSRQPVLADEKQFVYLLMHISHSYWGRLSWLTDFVALLKRDLDWQSLRALCHQSGMDTILKVTLGLIELNFCLEVPTTLKAGIPADYKSQLLLRFARSSLIKNRFPSYPVVHLERLICCPNLRYLRHELLTASGISLNDIALVPLPRNWFWLYYPLRPLLWLWRQSPFYTNRTSY